MSANRIEYTSEDLNGKIVDMHRIFEECGITIKRSEKGYVWEIRNNHSFATAEEALQDAQRLLEPKKLDEDFIWEPLFLVGRRARK